MLFKLEQPNPRATGRERNIRHSKHPFTSLLFCEAWEEMQVENAPGLVRVTLVI